MGWTKRQLVAQAFEEVGLAAYAFDIAPEQQQSAVRRLDALMASWEARGLHLGYRQSSSVSDGDLDEDSGIPDKALQAVYLALGISLAPGFGKTVAPETKAAAKQSLDALMIEPVIEQQLPGGVPLGAGNRRGAFGRKYTPEPDRSPLRNDPGEWLRE